MGYNAHVRAYYYWRWVLSEDDRYTEAMILRWINERYPY